MSRSWLAGINPVMKLAATLPPMALVMFTRDVATPALLAGAAVLALLTGSRMRPRVLLAGGGGLILFGLWSTYLFAALVRPELVADTPAVTYGWVSLPAGAWQIGAATALRMLAAMLLALVGSVGTTTDQLASALVRQCRVPYRFAYGTLAAVQFVPRYRHDLATLRAAHRARGILDPPGPVGYLRRTGRSLVPLLAGGARHAERLSLAMDARGFGAYPGRSDRDPATVRTKDVVLVGLSWALVVAVLLVTAQLGLLQLVGSDNGAM